MLKLRLILKMEEFLSRTSALDNREKGVFILLQFFILRKGDAGSASADIKELCLFLADGTSQRQTLKSIESINSKVEEMVIEKNGSIITITDSLIKKTANRKDYLSRYHKSVRAPKPNRTRTKKARPAIQIAEQSTEESKRRHTMFLELQRRYHPARTEDPSNKARDVYCTKLIEASKMADTNEDKAALEDKYHQKTLDYVFSMRRTKVWQDGGRYLKGIHKLVVNSPWEQSKNNSIDPNENGERLSQLRALDDIFSGEE